jgi:hypothetical protein
VVKLVRNSFLPQKSTARLRSQFVILNRWSQIATSSGHRSMKPKRTMAADIDPLILEIRGQKVILDADLSRIYGIATRVLNQAVKRNAERFPSDFMFRLTAEEAGTARRLRSQVVILKRGQHLKYLPYAFTEHGAIMAANVIRSPRAIQMSIFVIRAFVKMRTTLLDSRDLARKLAALEQELKSRLDLHEAAIVDVLQRIVRLISPRCVALLHAEGMDPLDAMKPQTV